MNERQLRVKMANGRKYYLQLCAPAGQEDIIFQRWLRLIYVLNVANGRISDPISFTSKQSGLHTIWKSASFRATPEKHWLQIVMAEEDSNEMVKEQLREANLVKSTSRSMESVPAAKRTIRKSGLSGASTTFTILLPASSPFPPLKVLLAALLKKPVESQPGRGTLPDHHQPLLPQDLPPQWPLDLVEWVLRQPRLTHPDNSAGMIE
nr:uncharacterized protein LOC118095793 [Zootoca vivipara]